MKKIIFLIILLSTFYFIPREANAQDAGLKFGNAWWYYIADSNYARLNKLGVFPFGLKTFGTSTFNGTLSFSSGFGILTNGGNINLTNGGAYLLDGTNLTSLFASTIHPNIWDSTQTFSMLANFNSGINVNGSIFISDENIYDIFGAFNRQNDWYRLNNYESLKVGNSLLTYSNGAVYNSLNFHAPSITTTADTTQDMFVQHLADFTGATFVGFPFVYKKAADTVESTGDLFLHSTNNANLRSEGTMDIESISDEIHIISPSSISIEGGAGSLSVDNDGLHTSNNVSIGNIMDAVTIKENGVLLSSLYLKKQQKQIYASPSNTQNRDGFYSTIRMAIDSAPSGSNINIATGIYNENIRISKRLFINFSNGVVVNGGDSIALNIYDIPDSCTITGNPTLISNNRAIQIYQHTNSNTTVNLDFYSGVSLTNTALYGDYSTSNNLVNISYYKLRGNKSSYLFGAGNRTNVVNIISKDSAYSSNSSPLADAGGYVIGGTFNITDNYLIGNSTALFASSANLNYKCRDIRNLNDTGHTVYANNSEVYITCNKIINATTLYSTVYAINNSNVVLNLTDTLRNTLGNTMTVDSTSSIRVNGGTIIDSSNTYSTVVCYGSGLFYNCNVKNLATSDARVFDFGNSVLPKIQLLNCYGEGNTSWGLMGIAINPNVTIRNTNFTNLNLSGYCMRNYASANVPITAFSSYTNVPHYNLGAGTFSFSSFPYDSVRTTSPDKLYALAVGNLNTTNFDTTKATMANQNEAVTGRWTYSDLTAFSDTVQIGGVKITIETTVRDKINGSLTISDSLNCGRFISTSTVTGSLFVATSNNGYQSTAGGAFFFSGRSGMYSSANGTMDFFKADGTTRSNLIGADYIADDATKGLVLKDTQGTPHYWRVTVNNSGVLVITDLGTTRP